MQCLVLSWTSCQNCLLIVFLSWLSCHICPAILCSVWDVLSQLSCNIDPLRKVSECLIKIVHNYINIYIYMYKNMKYVHPAQLIRLYAEQKTFMKQLVWQQSVKHKPIMQKSISKSCINKSLQNKMKSLISSAANSKYNCRCSFNVKLISTDTTPVI